MVLITDRFYHDAGDDDYAGDRDDGRGDDHDYSCFQITQVFHPKSFQQVNLNKELGLLCALLFEKDSGF